MLNVLTRRLLLIGFCSSWLMTFAQTQPAVAPGFGFIRTDLNHIDNHVRGLKHFYTRLEKLEQGRIRTVNIVHIGDSHIQADWFSGQVRVELQKRFGAVGRGLVFPYTVARTNSPTDIHSSSNIEWQVGRNVSNRANLPLGLSGITLHTDRPDFSLRLRVDDGPGGLDYSFNKVTLFTGKGADQYDLLASTQPLKGPATWQFSQERGKVYHTVEEGESVSKIAAKYGLRTEEIMQLNGLEDGRILVGQQLVIREEPKRSSQLSVAPRPSGVYPISLTQRAVNDFTTTIYLAEPTHNLYLQARPTAANQQEATLYGVVLENYNHSGVMYHMIGVNGAQFRHYVRSSYFAEQLRALQPDLVIISLGTNESVGYGFNGNRFYEDVDGLIHNIEQYLPHSAILLTTPPDAYRNRQGPNPNLTRCRDILVSYAYNNDLACWNLYDIMGGQGAVEQWYQASLAVNDRLHFNKRGYELQGKLLSMAILSGYDTYLTGR